MNEQAQAPVEPEALTPTDTEAPPVDEGEVFAWGQEEEGVPMVLLKRGEQAQTIIRGIPEIKTSDNPEKTAKWFETFLEVADRPDVDIIRVMLFLPDGNTEPRRRNQLYVEMQAFQQCYGWTPPAGTIPQVGDQYPELQEATGNITAGIERDRDGNYPDKNRVAKFLPATE